MIDESRSGTGRPDTCASGCINCAAARKVTSKVSENSPVHSVMPIIGSTAKEKASDLVDAVAQEEAKSGGTAVAQESFFGFVCRMIGRVGGSG